MLAGGTQRKTSTNQIELWNHCENPYPFVPNEVLEQAELGAGQPAQQIL